ncbi:TIGR03086 family metal-binding protein [Gordonia crocea]|uniref:Mycothiol-dependent maleylpyruvate isomerase metal-binding domain-containing protein n=1 Tax=Gordonia crocea TaxID=589162 RepID=A0A7I9V0V3_9ACTN|nr:TIGR03086 family metal-binding protein [Gordonia crocea]GED99025.1 hypothetical protein nbrc107697_30640 [Gordonia crocea]
MTDSVVNVYRDGLDFFGTIVQAVPDGAWQRPSPCADWTALDVLGHVGETTAIGVKILTGQPVDPNRSSPPSAAVDGDPAFWWVQVAGQAGEALAGGIDLDREVDSPVGRRTVRDGLSFPAADLYLHGWDLATATGTAVTIPPAAVAFINGMFEHVPDEVSRRPGVFGPAVPTPPDATPTQALIAFTGRDPGWTP